MTLIQSKFTKNYYSIKYFNDNLYKFTLLKFIKCNYTPERNEKIVKSARQKNDERLDNNLSRARTKIFEYASCNDFDFFLTLTLDSKKYDRYDLDKFIKDFSQLIRDYRKKYYLKIEYLLIPELHGNGAYHMHGLIKGLPYEHLTLNSNGYMDWKIYTDRFGYMSVDIIKNKDACSKYITKYISKSFSTRVAVTKNKKLYYASRGLQSAIKINDGEFLSKLQPPKQFENDYLITSMLDYKAYKTLIDDIENWIL